MPLGVLSVLSDEVFKPQVAQILIILVVDDGDKNQAGLWLTEQCTKHRTGWTVNPCPCAGLEQKDTALPVRPGESRTIAPCSWEAKRR